VGAVRTAAPRELSSIISAGASPDIVIYTRFAGFAGMALKVVGGMVRVRGSQTRVCRVFMLGLLGCYSVVTWLILG
jgi:hypothetical protein